MHLGYDKEKLKKRKERDPVSFKREYESEFADAGEAYLPGDKLDASIQRGVLMQTWRPGVRYFSHCDLSGGRHDYWAIAVAHMEGSRVIVDRVEALEYSKTIDQVAQRFAEILSSYGLGTVTGDDYAAELKIPYFTRNRVSYQVSELKANEIYLEVLPLFLAGMIQLPDYELLEKQLRQLERKPSPSGRGKIDHAPAGFDDAAIACCGAIWQVSRNSNSIPGNDYDNISQAVTNYDPVQRGMDEYQPPQRPPRHPQLLPPNLRAQFEDDSVTRADRNYDAFDRD